MRKINEGAEAIIYLSDLVGTPAILKRRIVKDYRIKQMDDKIRTFRSRNEARIIGIASRAGVRSPKLLLYDGYDIYMTILKGERLDSLLKSGVSKKTSQSIGGLLADIHNTHISHGDYTPANLMVDKGEAYIIDFGLAQITESVEAMALDLLLIKRAMGRNDYLKVLSSYRGKAIKAKETIGRLEAIERRGRYQTRTIASG